MSDIAYLAPQASGHTWYPYSFVAPRESNEPFLSSALAKVETVVRSIEQTGVHRERIVIAGFSQGACLSTEFVVRHPARYGGLVALTGGLIGPGHASTRYKSIDWPWVGWRGHLRSWGAATRTLTFHGPASKSLQKATPRSSLVGK